ncbi:MAG: hypothetical protein IPG11_16010 [Flavobacteriales bacterium]|jgi:hypothetical protein|nr:hypothetical protein [Flavobacteriales bacterium]
MNKAIGLVLSAAIASCCSHKEAQVPAEEAPNSAGPATVEAAGPPAIVYRTRVDVGDAVPITLSADGKEVVNYPHPKDLVQNGALSVPTVLGNGYLLDNRGVGLNTVFLKWSYAEYASLEQAPTLAELVDGIAFRDPFEEMYDCGLRLKYADPAKELAAIVASGAFPTRCKRLK